MRFNYHFEPSFGWMNDPNGLVYYKGLYHAFFQHFPYQPVWGPMHWGHCVSSDLVHWKEVEIALRPDQVYENGGGCFSGSAIVKDGRLYVFYTAVSNLWGQTQCMAYSDDGFHFTKYSGNPILPKCPVNSGSPASNGDFRDPKVTYMDGHYYMVCGSREYAGTSFTPMVLLFRSDDLVHWDYQGPLVRGEQLGIVPECPDFFKIRSEDGRDRYVLLYSRMQTLQASCRIMVGDFDGKTFTCTEEQTPEQGPDFYAPQSFQAPDGRRIVIAWHYHWGKPLTPGAYTAGALTASRCLTVDSNDMVHLEPVKELEPYLTSNSDKVKVLGNHVTVTDTEKPIFDKKFDHISDIRILEDTKSVEVFINKGTCNVSGWLSDTLIGQGGRE
ncbi:MAG TPA: hypothetical protein DEP00_03885 [Lachnospiraceae bacterium]|nr:hypothetical protein [Lachnospiraceae bacterium]